MASNYNNPINILDSTNAAGVGSGGSLNVEGGISVKKDTFIGGSLSVSGTSTAFSDNILVMNQNPVSSKDTGILFERYSNDFTDGKRFSGLVYTETSDEFVFGYANADPDTTGVTFGNYIPIRAQQLLLMSTENATSLTSGGSLTVLGGASISKSLNTGSITTGDINFTGDLYKNGVLYNPGSQWNTVNSNVVYTKGNVGIGTTSPNTTLDVIGTINATTIVSNNYTGGSMSLSGDLIVGGSVVTVNITTTNVKDINISTGTLNVSETAYITTATIPTLLNTNQVATNISLGTLNVSTGITSASAQVTNLNTTTGTIGTLLNTNQMSTNITSSTARVTTNLLALGNSNTIGNIFTTGGNIGIGTTSPGENLTIKGTNVLTSIIANDESQNVTLFLGTPWQGNVSNGLKTALIAQGKNNFSRARLHFCLDDTLTNSTANNAAISNSRMMIDSNGNVGIATTVPGTTLDVSGTGRITTSLTTGALYSTNQTSTNIVATNISSGALNLSTGLTSASAQITNINSTNITVGTLNLTNLSTTNITSATLNLSTGLTSASGQVTNLNAITSTISTLLNTNAVSTNISSGTLNVSTGITSASAQITNINSTNITVGALNLTNLSTTNITSATLNLSTGLTSGSAQITNLNAITSTIATARITSNLLALGNSNTMGAIMTTGGNVGVGTGSPGEMLDVRGNLRVGGSTQANYIAFYGTFNDGSGSWNHSYIGERIYGGTEDSELLLFKGNDANGDRIRLLASEHRIDTFSGALNGTFEGVGTSGTTRVFINNSGNVGIGTTSPATTLDVTGSGRFSGEVTMGSLKVLGLTDTLNLTVTNISSGILNLSTGLTSASARITNLNVTTSTIATLLNTNQSSTNITSGTLNLVTGLTSASAQITNINSTNITVGTLNLTNLSTSNISSGTLNLSTGLTSASIQVTNENITTSTIATLLNTNQNSTNITVGTLNVSSRLTITSSAINSPLTINQNYTSGGYPHAAIFTNSGLVSNDAHAIVVGWSTGTKNSAYFGFIYATAGSNTNCLTMGLWGADKLVNINGSGDMGIGTTNPAYKLDVNGTANIKTSLTTGILYSSSQTTTNIVATNISSGALNLSNGLTSASAEITNANSTTSTIATARITTNLLAIGNSNTMGAIITTGGNVGIGTGSPGEMLDMRGNLRVGGSTQANYIAFYGTFNDSPGSWNHCYIGERIYGGTEDSELFLFKGNDSADRIRLLAGEIRFDTFSGNLNGAFNGVGTSGSTKMVLSNSGKLGIGTTAPGVGYGGAISDALLTLRNGTYGGDNGKSTILIGGDADHYSSITSEHIGGGLTYLAFGTCSTNVNPSEKMRITSDGKVGIGKNNPSYLLELSVDSAAKPSTNTWTISSDQRLKTNITLANLDICYDNVKNIPLKRYTWLDEVYTLEQVSDRSKLGWIAQDVETFLPKSVEQKEMFGYSDCRTLNSDQIIASLYGAVQKLIQKVEVLETQLANLQN